MAVKTRKVQIKGLNDAKYIAAIVYISSFQFLIHIIVTFTLGNKVDTFPAVLTMFVLLGTMALQGLLFIPKVKRLCAIYI